MVRIGGRWHVPTSEVARLLGPLVTVLSRLVVLVALLALTCMYLCTASDACRDLMTRVHCPLLGMS